MNSEDLKAFNNAQIGEIKKYKWIRSEEANHDVGENNAALEWIGKYGKTFHDYWFGLLSRKKKQKKDNEF